MDFLLPPLVLFRVPPALTRIFSCSGTRKCVHLGMWAPFFSISSPPILRFFFFDWNLLGFLFPWWIWNNFFQVAPLDLVSGFTAFPHSLRLGFHCWLHCDCASDELNVKASDFLPFFSWFSQRPLRVVKGSNLYPIQRVDDLKSSDESESRFFFVSMTLFFLSTQPQYALLLYIPTYAWPKCVVVEECGFLRPRLLVLSSLLLISISSPLFTQEIYAPPFSPRSVPL